MKTEDNILDHIDLARTGIIVLKEFIKQFEDMTGNELTGVTDALDEIESEMTQVYVLTAVRERKDKL